jgi:anthranilate phosphoribosyltransferase
MAGVLAGRGARALVFRGLADGLDEMAATGPIEVWETRDGAVSFEVLDPVGQLGLAPIVLEDLRGADAVHNAQVARRVLDGEGGAIRETVLLNAAAGLVAGAALPGLMEGSLAERLTAGLAISAQAIDSGAAARVLDRWVAASQML